LAFASSACRARALIAAACQEEPAIDKRRPGFRRLGSPKAAGITELLADIACQSISRLPEAAENQGRHSSQIQPQKAYPARPERLQETPPHRTMLRADEEFSRITTWQQVAEHSTAPPIALPQPPPIPRL
jgi:hypothetical protein